MDLLLYQVHQDIFNLVPVCLSVSPSILEDALELLVRQSVQVVVRFRFNHISIIVHVLDAGELAERGLVDSLRALSSQTSDP